MVLKTLFLVGLKFCKIFCDLSPSDEDYENKDENYDDDNDNDGVENDYD